MWSQMGHRCMFQGCEIRRGSFSDLFLPTPEARSTCACGSALWPTLPCSTCMFVNKANCTKARQHNFTHSRRKRVILPYSIQKRLSRFCENLVEFHRFSAKQDAVFHPPPPQKAQLLVHLGKFCENLVEFRRVWQKQGDSAVFQWVVGHTLPTSLSTSSSAISWNSSHPTSWAGLSTPASVCTLISARTKQPEWLQVHFRDQAGQLDGGWGWGRQSWSPKKYY